MALIGYFGSNRYPIEREENGDEHGPRILWFCGCPDKKGMFYPLEICRHLRAIFESYRTNGRAPKRLHLTEEGRAIEQAECVCAREHREEELDEFVGPPSEL